MFLMSRCLSTVSYPLSKAENFLMLLRLKQHFRQYEKLDHQKASQTPMLNVLIPFSLSAMQVRASG